jgi:hypothetical protein
MFNFIFMKKCYPLLFLLITSVNVFGQITLMKEDYYDFDNVYYRGNQNTGLEDVDLTLSTGPNQTWDFSWINQTVNDTLRISKADLTPFFNEFPASDYGLTSTGSNYFYEEITNDGARILGKVNYDIFNSVYTVYRFNTPQLTFPFPLTYTDNYSFTQQYRVQYPAYFPGADSIRQYNFSQFEIEADAWGTLIVPAGTFDVLRLKQTSIITDTIYTFTDPGGWSSGGINIDTTETFLFYAKEVGYRIMTLAQRVNGVSRNLSYLAGYNLSVGDDIHAHVNAIFPVPANEQVVVDVNQAGELRLTDLQGRILLQKPVADGQTRLQVDHLPQGVYFIHVLGVEGRLTPARKLIISHP